MAANTGQGPDMVWGLYSLPQLFPTSASRSATSPIISARSTAAGSRRGGHRQGKGKWIAIPVAFNGGYINYRISAVEKAGFKKFPADTAGFLELCQAMKKNNTPAGFALGHASGDGNAWCTGCCGPTAPTSSTRTRR